MYSVKAELYGLNEACMRKKMLFRHDTRPQEFSMRGLGPAARSMATYRPPVVVQDISVLLQKGSLSA